MAGEWDSGPLDELVDDIVDRRGVTPLKLGSAFVPTGYRVISAKAIKNRRVDLSADDPRFVDEATYRKWMTTPLFADDVILTSEAPLGEAAYIREPVEWCLGQRLFAIRTKKSRLHGRFLFYALQSEDVRHDLFSRATGTTAQGVRQSELRRVRIPLPDVVEQRAIAHILGTLDDKVDLNRRMNDTLEAIARGVFKSWFVDFDPVHAKAEGRDPRLPRPLADLFPDCLVASEVGEIPEGWQARPLREVCDAIFSGGTPSTTRSEYWGRGIPWLSSGETRSRFIVATEKTISAEGVAHSSTRLARAGATVIASAGQGYTRGQTSMLMFDSYINQSVIVLEADPRYTSDAYLFFDLERRYEQFRRLSDAHSSRGSLTTKMLADLRVVVPPRTLVEAFDRIAVPFGRTIAAALGESRSLSALRHTLLPKLVSGELRVPIAGRRIGRHV